MTALDRVIDALEKHGSRVTGGGNRRQCQCPAHEDRMPSLSLAGIEGRALLYDHGGCDIRDVLAAIGLTTADLFDDPRGQDYRYHDGRIVHRSPDKKFRQSGHSNGTSQLFRLPKVTAAIKAGTSVYVVEGEQDVLALEELGAVATTAPMGATNWGKVDPGPLKGAHVVIVPDRDTAGERWLKDVTTSLKPLARSIRVARAKTGNDAADHLAAGHDLDDLDEDNDAYTEAPRPTWEPQDLAAILDGTYVPVEPALLPRTDGQCLLYPARVHDIHGESESGKSMVIQAEAARLLALGRGVVIIDYESTASTVVGRLLLMGVEPDAIGAHLAYIRPQRSPIDPAEIDAWHQLLARRDVALIILDGVTEALATMSKSTKDNDEVTAWMRNVPHNLAEQTGAAVVLIDHVTKSTEGRGRFAIGAQAKMMSVDGASYAVEVVEPLGRGMRGVLRLWVGKDREGAIRPRCGRFNPEDRTQVAATIVVDSTAGPITVVVQAPDDLIGTERKPFRPTHLMELISRALETSTAPLTGNDIVKSAIYVVGKTQAKAAGLRVLVDEGFVGVEAGPRNSVLHKSVRPYREANDPAASDQGTSGGLASGSASPASTGSPEDGASAPILPPGTSQRKLAPVPGTSGEPVGTSQPVPSGICPACGWALDSYGHETACSPTLGGSDDAA